jgi:hypothetical protein
MTRVRFLILLVGCAGPFVDLDKPSKSQSITASSCGSTKITAERVLNNMEPPSSLPSEVGGSGGLEPPEQAQLCVQLDNHASGTVRVDRSYLQLKCPREKQPWVPDSDDQEVIIHAGESKKFKVSFHYSPMPSGEDVAILFERAVKVEGRVVALPPLPLRKR